MTKDEFELRLMERLKAPWFEINRVAEELGVEPQFPTEADLQVDYPLIGAIAHYLFDVEELGRDGDDEDETIITVGMFIYGWEHDKRGTT